MTFYLKANRVIFLIAIALIFTTFAWADKTPFETAIFESAKYGISFDYPKDWPRDGESKEKIFKATLDTGAKRKAIILGVSEKDNENQTIEEIFKETKNAFSGTGLKITKTEEVSFQGVQAFKITFEQETTVVNMKIYAVECYS